MYSTKLHHISESYGSSYCFVLVFGVSSSLQHTVKWSITLRIYPACSLYTVREGIMFCKVESSLKVPNLYPGASEKGGVLLVTLLHVWNWDNLINRFI